MKEKEKDDIVIEEPQKKKKVNDEEKLKFIKTLKRSEYSIIEQIKNLHALTCRYNYHRSHENSE